MLGKTRAPRVRQRRSRAKGKATRHPTRISAHRWPAAWGMIRRIGRALATIAARYLPRPALVFLAALGQAVALQCLATAMRALQLAGRQPRALLALPQPLEEAAGRLPQQEPPGLARGQQRGLAQEEEQRQQEQRERRRVQLPGCQRQEQGCQRQEPGRPGLHRWEGARNWGHRQT